MVQMPTECIYMYVKLELLKKLFLIYVGVVIVIMGTPNIYFIIIYVMSCLLTFFLDKSYSNPSPINTNLLAETYSNASQRHQFSEFSQGSMPPDPPSGRPSTASPGVNPSLDHLFWIRPYQVQEEFWGRLWNQQQKAAFVQAENC